MYQYENHKNEKGLQRKLEVLYPKRALLSQKFKGTGIFDLKRTQIYTHTFA
jgi:hypothetical protein